jgi:signal transduction histidine kinase
LIIVLYLFKVIKGSEIFTTYKNVLYAYRFELFASTTMTCPFLVLLKTARILEIRNKELERALIKSEESDKLKTAFLTSINHEIRTPLNGIIGFTNLIIEPGLDNERRIDYSKGVILSSDQLLSIISNIIKFSKIKTGQTKLKIDSVSVNELFDNTYLYYSSLAKEKNLLFEIDRAEIGADDIIFTDKSSLKQIQEH